MYKQTSTHLGRHVTGVWQSVGVVAGALAVFTLDRQGGINDYACALVVLICGWLISTTLDASNWFNRNITIISNLERLFLNRSDEEFVHYFFLRHRRPGNIAGHFKIPLILAVAVAVLVLVYHFERRVLPGVHEPMAHFDWPRALPWITGILVAAIGWTHRRAIKKKDEKLQTRSPGYGV
jgi:hypothetical protein